MKFTIVILVLLFFASIPANAQRVLFKSDSYTILSDKVVEGKYEALAKSPVEIESSYQSDYKGLVSNDLSFKFSINGLDNERDHGKDHHLIIEPENGVFVSPVFTFGENDPADASSNKKSGKLNSDVTLTLRVNMTNVLNDFQTKGYYETFDGTKIYKKDFRGVYAAGGTAPLSWDFSSLADNDNYKMHDAGNGIYELKINIKHIEQPGLRKEKWISWKLSRDIAAYPAYNSPDTLIDALYNHAMEEMISNIRPDSAFMAGAKWTGVWTRDISYSIFLSLAMVNPDASRTSLMFKVKNDRIIQDTGTGGAWPVSSDRLVWALAAWEVYLNTGDMNWLKTSYKIIKNSVDDDLNTVLDKSTGLFRGESSFLDWREQTYPRWMDPKDIYSSENLGTNAVHYRALEILSQMAKILGKPSEKYIEAARRVKDGMKKYLYLSGKNYFGQYLYGRNYLTLSPKSEALGEGLSVLFNIPSSGTAKKIIANVPVTKYGITCVYPQTPGIPPYHNDAVWPFVESYWAWASAKEGNAASVTRALASVYRAASLFLSDKENMVASTGDYLGTEINSDRQLWSVAGNLALIYRVIYGMSLTADGLEFHPFIPREYSGSRTLNNFRYRNSILSISINGFGNKIKSFKLDGKILKQSRIPAGLLGEHKIVIDMNNHLDGSAKINLVEDKFTPETPVVEYSRNSLTWKQVKNAVEYVVYKNGAEYLKTSKTEVKIKDVRDYAEFQVAAVGNGGLKSFLSEPAAVFAGKDEILVQAESADKDVQNKFKGFSGSGYVVLDKTLHPDQTVKFNVDIPAGGEYIIDFRYANGNGPINTDNKCAVRTLKVDNKTAGPVILPQRGIDNWSSWGYSNSILTKLNKGRHSLEIIFTPSDNNMNLETNTALLDYVRLIKMN